MSKRASKISLMMILLGFVLMFASVGPAQAQEPVGTGPADGSFLSSDGAGRLGGAIGAGLVIMGGAAGIGRIGGRSPARSTPR